MKGLQCMRSYSAREKACVYNVQALTIPPMTLVPVIALSSYYDVMLREKDGNVIE